MFGNDQFEEYLFVTFQICCVLLNVFQEISFK